MTKWSQMKAGGKSAGSKVLDKFEHSWGLITCYAKAHATTSLRICNCSLARTHSEIAVSRQETLKHLYLTA